jgi:phytoene synthase
MAFAMDPALDADLPDPLRLALAWTPRSTRRATLALLALDTRLAGFVRRGTEPLPVQMRLAWWRETLQAAPAAWPRGDPLLDELREWDTPAQLVELVDGWEGLLGEQLDAEAIRAFAAGRERAWTVLAKQIGIGEARAEEAARSWALADLATNVSDESERKLVLQESAGLRPQIPSERPLRPLAVLAALGRRALRRGGRPLLEGRGAGLLALRVGMFGR